MAARAGAAASTSTPVIISVARAKQLATFRMSMREGVVYGTASIKQETGRPGNKHSAKNVRNSVSENAAAIAPVTTLRRRPSTRLGRRHDRLQLPVHRLCRHDVRAGDAGADVASQVDRELRVHARD